MVDDTLARFLPKGFKSSPGPIDVPTGDAIGGKSEQGDAIGSAGSGAVGDDTRTVDPVSISNAKRGKRDKRKGGWSEARREAYEARRNSTSGDEKEEVVVSAETSPPYGESIIAQIAFYLQLFHGQGDFALSDKEAHGLASAIAGVARYHVRVTTGGKGMAYMALLGTAAMVYAPKVMAKQARDKARAAAAQHAGPTQPMES